MADEPGPNDVSGGSTNVGGDAVALRRHSGEQVLDAEYESLPSAAAPRQASAIATSSSPVVGMQTLRRPGSSGPAARGRRGGPLFWAMGLVITVSAFWVAGGHALVQGLALPSGQKSPRSLALHGVTSRVDRSGARPLLFVDGEAVNEGGGTMRLPAFEITVTDNQGSVTIYRLGTQDRSMAPGERFAFSSRLDVPKNGVRTVAVTFSD